MSNTTIAQCIDTAAREFGVTTHEMLYADRRIRAARPRQVAMWLAHGLTGKSHTQIGRVLAGRAGTTVRHGIRRIDELRAEDAAFRARIDKLRQSLKEIEKAA